MDSANNKQVDGWSFVGDNSRKNSRSPTRYEPQYVDDPEKAKIEAKIKKQLAA